MILEEKIKKVNEVLKTSENVYVRTVDSEGNVYYDLVLNWIDGEYAEDSSILLLMNGAGINPLTSDEINKSVFYVWSLMSNRHKREFRTCMGQATICDTIFNMFDKLKNRKK